MGVRVGTAYQERWRRLGERGCLRIRLTASSFWLCLATHCGRVAESHLPHAVMSARGHLRLPPLTEAGLLPATPQLLVSASIPPALSVSELRKRSSWKHPSEVKQAMSQSNR